MPSPAAPLVAVVEDDAELRTLLLRGLEEEGFVARGYGTGAETLRIVPELAPDLLVIDIGLPDSDGRDLVQALRARGISAPVMFLTARDALTDRLAGFRVGGDDYVTKPFALDEVIARLQALLRRAPSDQVLECGPLRLDPVTHAVTCGERREELTPTEFRLLAALVSRSGDALRRRDLVRTAWPDGAIVHDNTLDVYVARLRRKLRAMPGAPKIFTVYGVGYSLR